MHTHYINIYIYIHIIFSSPARISKKRTVPPPSCKLYAKSPGSGHGSGCEQKKGGKRRRKKIKENEEEKKILFFKKRKRKNIRTDVHNVV